MTLGADKTVCATELREAMRASLETQQPGTGKNVDMDQVRKNFDALGQGVFTILTQEALVVPSADFATWLGALLSWAAAMLAWQQGVAKAFADWAPTQQADVDFRNAVRSLAVPPAPPALPASLGRIT